MNIYGSSLQALFSKAQEQNYKKELINSARWRHYSILTSFCSISINYAGQYLAIKIGTNIL